DTDMLDDTRRVYGRHMDADSWSDTSPQEWAAKVVRAVERGDHVLGPGGRLALAKLASRGPAALFEPALGPGEVELEEPPEAAVGAQALGLARRGKPVLAPVPERLRVARR